MADVTEITDVTRNQATINYTLERIYLGGIGTPNLFTRMDYANISGAEETVELYTVMGRVAATQKLVPCLSTATDGSQVPICIIDEKQDAIAIAGTVDAVHVCNGGRLNSALVVFQNGTDTLATPVTGIDTLTIQTMEQWLIQNGNNFAFVATTDVTGHR